MHIQPILALIPYMSFARSLQTALRSSSLHLRNTLHTSHSAMSTITQGDKVLVTGASGFIAVHLCRDLLKKGYKVRGTVRSEEKGEYLKDLLKSQDFEYVLVDDITKVRRCVETLDLVQRR